MRWALRQSQSYFPKLELGVHYKKQIQTWGRRNPVFAVRTGPVALPGALLSLAKARRAQRLRFSSWLHPAAGPARALQETQSVSKWAVLGCWRDVELKGSPNRSARPLVTSSNPKHLLQALDLCTDVGTGVSPNLMFQGSGKAQDENSVMRVPSPLPRINLGVILEPQSPLPALSLALVGVSLLQPRVPVTPAKPPELPMGVFPTSVCPGESALPPRWAEINTWENSSCPSSDGQQRSAELAAWKRLLPAGCQLRRST